MYFLFNFLQLSSYLHKKFDFQVGKYFFLLLFSGYSVVAQGRKSDYEKEILSLKSWLQAKNSCNFHTKRVIMKLNKFLVKLRAYQNENAPLEIISTHFGPVLICKCYILCTQTVFLLEFFARSPIFPEILRGSSAFSSANLLSSK